MNTWTLIGCAVPLAILILLLAARRVDRGVDPTQLLLDPDLIGRVRTLAHTDQKLQAIKALRDGTPGLGLGAAKLMVDKMAAAPAAPTAPTAPEGNGAVTMADLLPSSSPVPLDVELAARSLKSAGQPIQAVKLVRPHTRNLGEAKVYVDGL